MHIFIHYRTSDLQQSPSYVTMQSKCNVDNFDTDYEDVTNNDPVYYEPIQLQSLNISESVAMCHKVAAESDSVDKLVENPMYEAYSKCKNDEDVVESIYETIPGEYYQV